MQEEKTLREENKKREAAQKKKTRSNNTPPMVDAFLPRYCRHGLGGSAAYAPLLVENSRAQPVPNPWKCRLQSGANAGRKMISARSLHH